MQFERGNTRFVILTEHRAIKIARFRALYWTFRQLRKLQHTSVKQCLKKEQKSVLKAFIQNLFLGMRANLTESRFSETYSNAKIEPVIFSFLGLVNVMVRGEPVTDDELPSCPFQDLKEYVMTTPELVWLLRAEQFARFGNEIRLIDYGNRRYAEVLASQPNTYLRSKLTVPVTN